MRKYLCQSKMAKPYRLECSRKKLESRAVELHLMPWVKNSCQIVLSYQSLVLLLYILAFAYASSLNPFRSALIVFFLCMLLYHSLAFE